MLLTQGAVSVAASSAIIILCTAALFLSGYVIQQRTLRDLRAAIRPATKPPPLIFLPDRFRKETTELDGRIFEVDDDGVPTRQEMTVEIKQTVPKTQRTFPSSRQNGPGLQTNLDTGVPLIGEAAARKQSKKKKTAAAEEQLLSRAERRKRIREEMVESSQAQDQAKGKARITSASGGEERTCRSIKHDGSHEWNSNQHGRPAFGFVLDIMGKDMEAVSLSSVLREGD